VVLSKGDRRDLKIGGVGLCIGRRAQEAKVNYQCRKNLAGLTTPPVPEFNQLKKRTNPAHFWAWLVSEKKTVWFPYDTTQKGTAYGNLPEQ